MSTSDLLSSTLNWPGKGLYGLKSSVLQTTENNLVKQSIVSDHMKNHYRRMHSARSAVDSKPPKAMVLGQKCRDRARKEMAQLAYTQNLLDEFSGTTPRGRSSFSARPGQFVQSQPTTSRARSRSVQSARMVTRSLSMNRPMQTLPRNDSSNGDIASKLFGGGVLSQALTSMAAISRITSSERNKGSADVLDKHPDSFTQPEPEEYQPRLVKRDAAPRLLEYRNYNPPRKGKPRPASATKKPEKTEEVPANKNPKKDDEQLALREQLNKSLELRHNVEKKIKKAKAAPYPPLKKQSDEALKQFGLTERERLQYVRFMQEVTDAIIRNNLTTEPAIEKLYEIHIDRNRETLDENRLRGLLQALKDDLGVLSSRKSDTYASVHRASTYDREPLPAQSRPSARDDPSNSTPKTPRSHRRTSDYDMNTPLPWQLEDNAHKQATIPEHETRADSSDHLFSPTSATIKPKPRLSLQTKAEQQPSPSEEVESTNFNSTIRQSKPTLFDLDWMNGAQPTESIEEKHEASPVPNVHQHDQDLEPYASNDFDENDDSDR